MVRGIKKVGQLFVLTMAAYNLVRMRTFRTPSCAGMVTKKSEERSCSATQDRRNVDSTALFVDAAR
jgi:hypothetical protein